MSQVQGCILVVDDNEMNRDMLSRRLTRQGHEVIVAEDGQQALQMLSAHAYDLVLLDIMMPKMTGYEVLEKMKADTNFKHIPVIMISAVDDLDIVVKCIEIGAEDYLFKPFNPVLLKARVETTLEKRRLYAQSILSMQRFKPSLEAIKTNTDYLLSGNGGTISQHQSEVIHHIQEQIDHLLKLVPEDS
jgi:DNA-binding response OmpR family regulator